MSDKIPGVVSFQFVDNGTYVRIHFVDEENGEVYWIDFNPREIYEIGQWAQQNVAEQ